MNRRVSLPDKVNLYTIILADANLSSTSKVIAGWLMFYHHNSLTGMCNPSNRTVAKAIHIRAENVNRHIGTLVKAGYVIARRRSGSSNRYDFNWTKGSKSQVGALRRQLRRKVHEEDMIESAIPVDEIVNTPCSNRQHGHDENVNLIHESKTVTEDGNLILSGEILGFASFVDGESSSHQLVASQIGNTLSSFCSIYPLRITDNELPAVRAAFERALKIGNVDSILAGAMRYANECDGREAQFIASPVNWLNGRRWNSTDKIKSEVVVLGADGNPVIPANQSRPASRRQEIARWKPSSKSPFSFQ